MLKDAKMKMAADFSSLGPSLLYRSLSVQNTIIKGQILWKKMNAFQYFRLITSVKNELGLNVLVAKRVLLSYLFPIICPFPPKHLTCGSVNF